jgi:hypothetical protein
MSVLDSILAAGSGGLLGTLGSIGGRALGIWEAKEKRKDQELQNKHDTAMWSHELEMATFNKGAVAQAADINLKEVTTTGSFEGLKASIAADAAIDPGYKWVAAVRSLMRPVLTVFLWIGFGLAFNSAMKAVHEHVAGLDAQGIIKYYIDTIGMMATMATAWWFGDRTIRN